MDLIDLKNRIIACYSGEQDDLELLLALVEEDKAIFPFNEYEHLIYYMLGRGNMTFQQYLDLRNEYISENPNLWIFEISAPRGFGEKFAQTYIQGKCSKIKKASKKIDNNFSGEYDLWLDGIKIEVKASRAVDSDSEEPLYMKALSRTSQKRFLMNFQQLKPQCCDVFIWVAVFRDEILVWILNSAEVLNHTLFSKGQHRGNKGNEGQMHIKDDNINQLDNFLLKGDNIEDLIREAARR